MSRPNLVITRESGSVHYVVFTVSTNTDREVVIFSPHH